MRIAEQQALNDLAWAVTSPSFVVGHQVADQADFSEDGIDAAELVDFLAQNQSHRVGRYFETLVLFWLTRVRNIEVVGSGLQVRDGNRTVGEIDFMFRDESGRMCHWEAAIKFFLHHPRPGVSHFPGPNAADNFERKTEKLFRQQLELSREHFPQVEVREAFVKGRVFYHPQSVPLNDLPDRMSPAHLRGTWVRYREFADHAAMLEEQHVGGVGGYIVVKPNWLAPIVKPQIQTLPELIGQLRDHEAEHGNPVMVSLCSSPGSAELDRLFVVPDLWPSN